MDSATAQSFPLAARLLRAADFAQVLRDGARSKDTCFRIVYLPRPRGGPARLGLAISIAAAGGAVGRNRLKRIVRESFRMQRSALPAVDLVVMAQSAARDAPASALRDSLGAHWRRIARRCARSSSD